MMLRNIFVVSYKCLDSTQQSGWDTATDTWLELTPLHCWPVFVVIERRKETSTNLTLLPYYVVANLY